MLLRKYSCPPCQFLYFICRTIPHNTTAVLLHPAIQAVLPTPMDPLCNASLPMYRYHIPSVPATVFVSLLHILVSADPLSFNIPGGLGGWPLIKPLGQRWLLQVLFSTPEHVGPCFRCEASSDG